MKFKNFFLSCSSTSGGRSRKVEEKQQKYGGLRPVSPPAPTLLASTNVPTTIQHPVVVAAADLRQDYYTGPRKKHLTNSYSSYSCGSASSHSSSKSGSCTSASSGIGSYSSSNSNPNSISKNKRTLDSRSGRYRSERQLKPKCTSRQCCNNGKEFHHKITLADYDASPTPPDDLGVKVGDRVVWLREPPQTNEAGKVKWIGIIENEEIAGIEFDRQLGLGSGWYKNRQLFTCEPQCGGLVAVAGLILEDDYFYNPNIPSSSSSPVSPYNDRKVSNKRLTSGGGSAGHSSPSPSSSSSTSLEIDQRNQVVQEQQSHYGSRQQFSQPVDYTSHTWNSPAKTELDESTLLVGDFTVVPAVLPVVDCGDGHFDPPSGEYKYPKREIMPIPHIVQPIREEDVDRINGRQKGIQGHRNSCYLDATLFSMFSFSSVFDSILLQDYRHVVNRRDEEDESLSRNVQKILRDDIVNPLRKNLYCNASNVMKLRETMEHLDGKLTCEEMDPQEFLQLLFDKVLNLSEFMSLSSGQSDFFHQVLVQQTDQDRHKIPSIQQLFEQSLMLQELKLKGVPQPALILQMPRSGNKYKMYDGILPNLTIDITDLLEDIPRTCIICGSLATHECSSCYGKFNSGGKDRDSSICSPVGSGAESTAFCETCVNQIHKRKDRQGHMQTVMPIKYSFSASQYFPNAINTSSSNDPSRYYFGQSQIGNWGNPSFNRNPTPLISSIPPPSNSNFSPYASRSIPRITMDLFAVICIETSHFVSFVKCGSDRKAPWVFFDSMADRVENVNGTGHNIPQVRLLPNMGSWLDSLENKGVEKLMMEESNFPPDLKRLLADPYICLYYSKESSMYS